MCLILTKKLLMFNLNLSFDVQHVLSREAFVIIQNCNASCCIHIILIQGKMQIQKQVDVENKAKVRHHKRKSYIKFIDIFKDIKDH